MKPFLFLILLPIWANAQTSSCFGTPARGSLEKGVQLPFKGQNFTAYSLVGYLAGRTYVHSEVKDIILNAYMSLTEQLPSVVYKYAETGLVKGGVFKPHKTHQNGLSADFMTPMMAADGRSVHLPTHPFNKFGYAIEIDHKGHYGELKIDFDAMAAHIVQLDKEAKSNGYQLLRVIFDPQLQDLLFKSKYKDYLRSHIQFSTKPSWVRHDEHYHVDFKIPCQ